MFSEEFCIALNGIAVNLNPVVSVKNPFDTVERILRCVIQTEINDWLAVEAVLVEQLRHVAVNGLFTALAPVALNRDGHFFEAVLGEWSA